MTMPEPTMCDVIVIGGGPAGLAAAEHAALGGRLVTILDGVRGPGRKFLVAGRSGLNLTHNADAERVLASVGASAKRLFACVQALPPSAIRAWAAGLGTPTFVGTSGKVFPTEHHAAGLLHRWLARLDQHDVIRQHRQQLIGLSQHTPAQPDSPAGDRTLRVTTQGADPDGATSHWLARDVVLALGGGSWPKTGSTASWVPVLQALDIPVRPITPANCGVELPADEHRLRHAGSALKDLAASCGSLQAHGEAVLTAYGLEGNAVYPLIPALREALDAQQATGQPATITLDLVRRRDLAQVIDRLTAAGTKASFNNRLRKALRLTPPAIALLRQVCPEAPRLPPAELAATLKSLPVPVTGLRPLEEAISSAGGVAWDALDEHFALHALPRVHCVGEMVDWEAPTGGWLLSVCLAMGTWVGKQLAR